MTMPEQTPDREALREQIAAVLHSANNHVSSVCAICRYQADSVLAAALDVDGLRAENERLQSDVSLLIDLRDEMAGENERLRAALDWLVRLKDGPRDEAYAAAKDAAWGRARAALARASRRNQSGCNPR